MIRFPKVVDFQGRFRHLSRADSLLVELDEQLIRVGSCEWITRVFGIHLFRGEAWAQIGFAGDEGTSVLLHLWPRAKASQALVELKRWLQMPRDDRPRILDVIRLAQTATSS